MNVLDSTNDLFKHFTSLLLVHSLLANDVVKKLASFHVLHNQKQMLRSLDDLIELDDVWMTNKFQNVYFSRNTLYICHVNDPVLLKNFDCYFFSGGDVGGKFDFAKSALTKCFFLIWEWVPMR